MNVDMSDIFGTPPAPAPVLLTEIATPVTLKAEKPSNGSGLIPAVKSYSRSIQAKKIYVASEEEWLEIRKTGIGGSDAGAVCGVNPWKSPVEVWLDKTGQASEFTDNERMFWGRELEDVVANHFANLNGFKVRRNNAVLIHPEYDFMLANLDREIVGQEEKTILEVKTASEYTLKKWTEGEIPAICMTFENGVWVPAKGEILGNIPEHYQLQVQHYMAVTGATKAYLAVLIGGQRYMQYEISRDEELIGFLIKIESDFWQYVTTNTAPPMDESSLTESTLKALYGKSNGESIILPEEALLHIQHYQDFSAQEKAAKNGKDLAKMHLQSMLGEAECGAVGGTLVKWKNTERKGYEVQPTTYRNFGISTLKEAK